MSAHKLEYTDEKRDKEYYKTRNNSDYIDSERDALRLYIAGAYALAFLKFRSEIKVIGDFGCGAGGLLGFLKHNLPDRRYYGYEAGEGNVKVAREKGLNVLHVDFIEDHVEWPQFLILTDVLEHLDDPHAFLRRVPVGTYLLATVPAHETVEKHDSEHIWVWDRGEFKDVVKRAGFDVLQWGEMHTIQIVIGVKK